MKDKPYTFVGVVSARDNPVEYEWVYSVGISESHGYEVILLSDGGLHLYYELLELAVEEYLFKGKVKIGQVFEIEEFTVRGIPVRVRFEPVSDLQRTINGYARHTNNPKQIYQLFYGDRHNRLPGEDDFETNKLYKIL